MTRQSAAYFAQRPQPVRPTQQCWGPTLACSREYVNEPVYLVGDRGRAPHFVCEPCLVVLRQEFQLAFLTFPDRRERVR